MSASRLVPLRIPKEITTCANSAAVLLERAGRRLAGPLGPGDVAATESEIRDAAALLGWIKRMSPNSRNDTLALYMGHYGAPMTPNNVSTSGSIKEVYTLVKGFDSDEPERECMRHINFIAAESSPTKPEGQVLAQSMITSAELLRLAKVLRGKASKGHATLNQSGIEPFGVS